MQKTYSSKPVTAMPFEEGIVSAFREALNECIKDHGVHGPEQCEWFVLFPKDPNQCGDVLGESGSVAWKLR